MGVEDRDRHSLFGKMIKDGLRTSSLGPGSYEIAIPLVSQKKSFNATLKKDTK